MSPSAGWLRAPWPYLAVRKVVPGLFVQYGLRVLADGCREKNVATMGATPAGVGRLIGRRSIGRRVPDGRPLPRRESLPQRHSPAIDAAFCLNRLARRI